MLNNVLKEYIRISDTTLKEKTGKTATQWFKFLDDIDTTKKTHTEIATYLCQKFGNDKAWYFSCQGSSNEGLNEGLLERTA